MLKRIHIYNGLVATLVLPVAAMLKVPKTLKLNKPHYTKDIHISAYKGTQKTFKEHCHGFSPLGGPPLKESGWLQDCEMLFPDTATAKLIASPTQGLFYTLGSQFRPTHNKTLPAYSLSPELIGQLVGHMVTGDIFDIESACMKEYIGAWREQHKKMTGSAVGLEKTKQFLRLVQQALKEADSEKEKPLFAPYVPHKVLWALLYSKFQKKQDLAEALKALDKRTNCLIDPSVLDESAFLEDHYTLQDVEKFESTFTPEDSIKEYEQTIHAIIARQSHKPSLPKQVIQGCYGYKKQEPVPDCTEAALLESSVNMLLYNPDTGLYDLGLVHELIVPAKDFLLFLDKLTPDTLNDTDLRNAWMDLVSGHHFITHRRDGDYEIVPTADNILQLTNYLYGINARNFKELSELLSSSKQTISIDVQTIKYSHILTITLSGLKNTVYTVKLGGNHASVEREYPVSTEREYPVSKSVLEEVSKHHFSGTASIE